MAPPKTAAAKSRQSADNANVPTPPVRFQDDVKVVAKGKGKGETKIKAKRSGGFTSFLISFALRVAIFYVLIGALWQCPKKPFSLQYNLNDSRPVCRGIANVHSSAAPLVTPYIANAQARIEPYTKPYIDAASPYVSTAWTYSRPYYVRASRQGRRFYYRQVEPRRKRAMKQARTAVNPYIRQANAKYAETVQPQVDAFNRAIKPHMDVYRRDVRPYVQQAYAYSLQSSSVSYAFYMDKVHPRVLQGIRQVIHFYQHTVDPALRRAFSLYVRPQVDRILAKVFERNVHAVGSDAVKDAKQEAQEAVKQADAHKKETVKEAEEAAIRAEEDPSILDRINKAKENVLGQEEEDPVQAAKLKAELEAEAQKMSAQLEVWERGVASLIEKQYNLAIERLADLRNRKQSDLPDRFAAVTESFAEDEASAVLTRLERAFKKLSGETNSSPLESRLAEAQSIVKKQKAKLAASARSMSDQIDGFHEELIAQEIRSVEASADEVDRYVSEAQRAFRRAMKGAHEDLVEEWEGWDSGLGVRSDDFRDDLMAIQAGAPETSSRRKVTELKDEPNIARQCAELKAHADQLYNDALAEVESYAKAGLAHLRGEGGVFAQAARATDAISERAGALSSEAAAGMLEAALAARAKLGLGEEPQTGILARLHAATRSVSSAMGATPSAESFGESVSSVLDQGASTASAAYEAAADGLHSATRSAISAVGATPSPESVSEHAESIASRASSAFHANVREVKGAGSVEAATESIKSGASSASSAASVASESAESYVSEAYKAATDGAAEYVDAATGAVHSATRSALSAAGVSQTPEGAAEHLESLREQGASLFSAAGDAVHDATRTVFSAAGVSQTPESVSEHAQSVLDQVVDAFGAATDAASSAAAPASSSVSSVLSAGSSLASEAGDSASSALHSATRSVASAVGATPSPEGVSEHAESLLAAATGVFNAATTNAGNSATGIAQSVESVLSAASDATGDAGTYAQEATAKASSAVHEATRSAISAAGATPSPESAGEYVSSFVAGVQGAASEGLSSASSLADAGASSASSVASNASSSASSVFNEAASSASSVGSVGASSATSYAAPGVSAISSVASSLGDAGASSFASASQDASRVLHSVTREAYSAVGATPSPEGVREHVESVAQRAKESAKSVRDEL